MASITIIDSTQAVSTNGDVTKKAKRRLMVEYAFILLATGVPVQLAMENIRSRYKCGYRDSKIAVASACQKVRVSNPKKYKEEFRKSVMFWRSWSGNKELPVDLRFRARVQLDKIFGFVSSDKTYNKVKIHSTVNVVEQLITSRADVIDAPPALPSS